MGQGGGEVREVVLRGTGGAFGLVEGLGGCLGEREEFVLAWVCSGGICNQVRPVSAHARATVRVSRIVGCPIECDLYLDRW